METPAREIEPSWDLADIFASDEVAEGFAGRLAEGLATLDRDAAEPDAPLTRLLLDCERLEAELEHLNAYAECRRSRDLADAGAARLLARHVDLAAELAKAWGLLRARLAALTDAAFADLAAEAELASAGRRLEEERREGQTGLSPGEAALAAEFMVDSLHGWSELADEVFADLTFVAPAPGGGEAGTPFARRFDYFWGPDAGARRSAWSGLQSALEASGPVLAACLNGLTGARLTLLRRRGRDPVDDVVRRNSLEPATVETMLGVIRQESGVLHRYLDLKRSLLGLDSLGMQDRSAPLPGRASPPLPAGAIVRRVRDAFARISPAHAQSVDKLHAAGWIDASAASGRRTGAFCSFSPLSGEPRVFLNVDGSFYSQTVFAHELGHAYHDLILGRLRPFCSRVPSALAETASITAEHLFREGMLRDPAAPAALKIEAVAAELDTAVNYLLRLPRDFEFEREVYRARGRGRLTVESLCGMQASAHGDWFAGRLGEDSYAWAGSPLLYSSYTDFFNFSYTVGFLLASAIAEAFEREGERFTPVYDAFLARTGSQGAEAAAAEVLGFDLRGEAFWRAAMGRVFARLDALRQLTSEEVA